MSKMKSFTKFKKEILADKEVKKAYDDFGPEFEVVSLFIKRRLQQGLTQGELARRVGTRQAAISRFESGAYNPSLEFLHKVASGLDAEVRVSMKPRV